MPESSFEGTRRLDGYSVGKILLSDDGVHNMYILHSGDPAFLPRYTSTPRKTRTSQRPKPPPPPPSPQLFPPTPLPLTLPSIPPGPFSLSASLSASSNLALAPSLLTLKNASFANRPSCAQRCRPASCPLTRSSSSTVASLTLGSGWNSPREM